MKSRPVDSRSSPRRCWRWPRPLRGADADKVNLGVAIPAATHSFTAGIVWWANEAKKELEKTHQDLKITIKTAANAAEQANQLQDLVTVNKINALVIFPFESAALTSRWRRSRTRACT